MPRTEKSQFTTIGVRKDTRDRLKKFGTKGELYDDILNRLMDMCESQMKERR